MTSPSNTDSNLELFVASQQGILQHTVVIHNDYVECAVSGLTGKY